MRPEHRIPTTQQGDARQELLLMTTASVMALGAVVVLKPTNFVSNGYVDVPLLGPTSPIRAGIALLNLIVLGLALWILASVITSTVAVLGQRYRRTNRTVAVATRVARRIAPKRVRRLVEIAFSATLVTVLSVPNAAHASTSTSPSMPVTTGLAARLSKPNVRTDTTGQHWPHFPDSSARSAATEPGAPAARRPSDPEAKHRRVIAPIASIPDHRAASQAVDGNSATESPAHTPGRSAQELVIDLRPVERPLRRHVVAGGESFWSIAERTVRESGGRISDVARYWELLIDSNEDRLPVAGMPDLLFPGTVLVLPPVQAVAVR